MYEIYQYQVSGIKLSEPIVQEFYTQAIISNQCSIFNVHLKQKMYYQTKSNRL